MNGYLRTLRKALSRCRRARWLPAAGDRNTRLEEFELFNGFDQRRALLRPLSRLGPQAHRLLDLPSFSAVTRQQLGLAFRQCPGSGFRVFRRCGHEACV
jgi:hypothetical protein